MPVRIAVACAFLAGVSGCKSASPNTTPSRAEIRQERRAAQSKMEAARLELDQIPPPSKNQYLSVHSRDAYANPFLVVHPQTITLSILYRDQDPNAFNPGGVLRPIKARKQDLDIRPADLPEALSALPADVWPYGRVVAIEESPMAPRTERVAIRRNVEATIQVLNDLGVVVDEWTGSTGALLR
ncbi:MAG TPA: hypothetical protein VMB49_07400 [Acidobacteriaceae bacterium]|nr:hypothetical protein [Acidobacteriaceae bacterium]